MNNLLSGTGPHRRVRHTGNPVRFIFCTLEMNARPSAVSVAAFLAAGLLLAAVLFVAFFGRMDAGQGTLRRTVAAHVVLAPRAGTDANTVTLVTDAALYFAGTDVYRRMLTGPDGATPQNLRDIRVERATAGILTVSVPAATTDAAAAGATAARALRDMIGRYYDQETVGYTVTVTDSVAVPGALLSGANVLAAIWSLLCAFMVTGVVFGLVMIGTRRNDTADTMTATHASNARINLRSSHAIPGSVIGAAATAPDNESYMHQVYADYDKAIGETLRDDVAAQTAAKPTDTDTTEPTIPPGTAQTTADTMPPANLPIASDDDYISAIAASEEGETVTDDGTADIADHPGEIPLDAPAIATATTGAPPANLPVASDEDAATFLGHAAPVAATTVPTGEPDAAEVRKRLNELLAGTLKV